MPNNIEFILKTNHFKKYQNWKMHHKLERPSNVFWRNVRVEAAFFAMQSGYISRMLFVNLNEWLVWSYLAASTVIFFSFKMLKLRRYRYNPFWSLAFCTYWFLCKSPGVFNVEKREILGCGESFNHTLIENLKCLEYHQQPFCDELWQSKIIYTILRGL